MPKPTFLNSSLKQLQSVTRATYNPETASIASAVWKKHLQVNNPMWDYVTAKSFSVKTSAGSAHVMAMIDRRLPGLGLVGYFACTNSVAGCQVLKKASIWLNTHDGVKDIYGPINGTATSDYRLNLNDDYWFPGEPVNPLSHIKAFEQAGFSVFNHYVSGISKHYKLKAKLFLKMPNDQLGLVVRPFNVHDQESDLEIFHSLMTTIFPDQSIYCPTLSWKERLYNFKDREPMFNARYMYFLEYNNESIGLVVAYPHDTKLIIKTIGILPEHRGKNLSNLLVNKIYDIAAEDNLKAVVYAMVRIGNTVHKTRRPGVRIKRHYVTMKKSF